MRGHDSSRKDRETRLVFLFFLGTHTLNNLYSTPYVTAYGIYISILPVHQENEVCWIVDTFLLTPERQRAKLQLRSIIWN